MKGTLHTWLGAMVIAIAVPLATATPAQAPSGATAQCKDGSYSKAKTERGACSGHGGVATWFGTGSAGEKTDSKKATTPKGTSGAAGSSGQAPNPATSNVPAGSTGQCKDGTFTTAASKRGACSGHGGVMTWFAAQEAPAKPSNPDKAAATGQSPTPSNPPAPAQKAAPSTQAQPRPSDAPATATAQCNDGTYSFAKQHRGACSSHQGVKVWFK